MGYWDDYDRVMHCSRKVGRGYDTWDDWEGMVIHAAQFGLTACGVAVGGEQRGWFSAWRSDPVSCKRCVRVIQRAA